MSSLLSFLKEKIRFLLSLYCVYLEIWNMLNELTVNDGVVAHWKLQPRTFYFAEIMGTKNKAEVS